MSPNFGDKGNFYHGNEMQAGVSNSSSIQDLFYGHSYIVMPIRGTQDDEMFFKFIAPAPQSFQQSDIKTCNPEDGPHGSGGNMIKISKLLIDP
jgi:hypothetical protein